MRFPFALIAAVSFVTVAMPTDAHAQFVCDVPSPAATSITCTNTGPAGGAFGASTTSGTATIINPVGGFATSAAASSTDGSAVNINAGTVFVQLDTFAQSVTPRIASSLTQNTGIVGGFITTNALGGDATTINSGSVLSMFPGGQGITTTTDFGGNALTVNSGRVSGGIATYTQNLGGNATTINSGTTDYLASLTFTSGNAVSINSGTITDPAGNPPPPGFFGARFRSGMLTSAVGTGDATAINTGTVAGNGFNASILTTSDSGNALTINYGNSGGIFSLSGSNGGGGHATVVNYGTVTNGITANSGYFFGGAGNASVYNAGRVFGGIGSFADGLGSASVTNAGYVNGAGAPGNGVAISLAQSDFSTPTTLNILPGSRIIGFIDLNGDSFFPGTGTQINIFGGHDISSVLTFGGGCGCFNNLIDTGSVVNVFGGAPFVVNGNTVAILDPTSFALQDKNIADFSHTISSMVTSRLNNPASMSGGSTPIGFAPSGSVAADMARDAFAGISSLNYASTDRVLFSNPSVTAKDGTSVWAQGFAGQRVQDADAPTLRSVNNFYGGMVGVDKTFRPGLRIGGLLGAGSIQSTVDLNSGDTKSNIVFGGIYGRYAMNRAFFDFSLLGGHSNNDLRRNMSNNLVPGGLETATASYNGWFVSPEIAYGVKMPIAANLTMTPTGRVRYLAAGFGGYQETGSTT
ncbi:MAG: autotransporter domain-containing protein, partial [Rhizobiales bacterium]|nr:autotransporter domain-containing protein [Hyphomicrobiales bacterium]